MELTAYNWRQDERYSLVGPNDRREWMNAAEDGHPYRCAPLRLANVSELWIVAHEPTFVRWDPRAGRDLLSIDGLGESHFGHGIVTFRVPFVFDVSEPWCLLVKGPSNVVVPNAHALEGVIDPRAAAVGFTMNWLIQEGGTAIFERGKPIAAITLIDPAALHATEVRIRPLADHPRRDELEAWWQTRTDLFDEILAGREGPYADGEYTRAVRKTLPGVRFRGVRTSDTAP